MAREPVPTEGMVSGREYTSTRVRGFAPWNPRQATLDVIDQVQGILREYRAQAPLTIRQIFYIMVGRHRYPKTEQAYARLAEYLNRARRARLISFGLIRDDGTAATGGEGWDSPEQFWSSIRYYADSYAHNLRDGQPYHVELWVEAGGMVPQAAAVAREYDITTYSAGGFNGLTDKHQTASRLARQDKPAIVLHVGDYDPSGLSIVDALAEDVTALYYGLGGRDLEFKRIIVIPEQIERYALETAPQKETDRRGGYMDQTVQAEALPPDVLASEIRAAIEEVTDSGALAAAHELSESEREQVVAEFGRLAGDDEPEEE